MGKWEARVGEERYKQQVLSCCTHLEFQCNLNTCTYEQLQLKILAISRIYFGENTSACCTLPGNLKYSLWPISVYEYVLFQHSINYFCHMFSFSSLFAVSFVSTLFNKEKKPERMVSQVKFKLPNLTPDVS